MKKLIVAVIVLLFVALFGYTAFNKLLDVTKFEASMHKSELIAPYAAFLSYAVPITELIICVLLALPFLRLGKRTIPTKKIGLYGSALLMLLFTGYVVVTLIALSKNLPCTCGGFISSMTWRQHLIFNAAFLLLALLSIYLIEKNKNILATS